MTLGAMFNDAISVFAVTICLLWVSFAHALCALFPYYYGQRWIVGGKEVKQQVRVVIVVVVDVAVVFLFVLVYLFVPDPDISI